MNVDGGDRIVLPRASVSTDDPSPPPVLGRGLSTNSVLSTADTTASPALRRGSSSSSMRSIGRGSMGVKSEVVGDGSSGGMGKDPQVEGGSGTDDGITVKTSVAAVAASSPPVDHSRHDTTASLGPHTLEDLIERRNTNGGLALADASADHVLDGSMDHINAYNGTKLGSDEDSNKQQVPWVIVLPY
jgi:hypothetical protein